MKQNHTRLTFCCLLSICSVIIVYSFLYFKQQTLDQYVTTISLETNDYRRFHECLAITNSENNKTPKTQEDNNNLGDTRFSTGSKCSREKTNIAFLKTHKTAGSTITNILQRFGFYRNLTFVLPFKKIDQQRYNYIGGQGGTISRDNIIPKMPHETYNILCNHVVYNATAFDDILPNDTFLFTIIREPFSQFISTLNYYGTADEGYMADFLHSNASNPLREYLREPWEYEPRNPHYSLTNNKMSVDLGMPIDDIRNGSLIHSYLQILKENFHLVLLQEYFDESLILLKRHACWSFNEIIYVSHNLGSHSQRHKFNLLREDIDKHRMWNLADYTLYETFFKIFWDKVFQEKDFFKEVYYFKQIQQRVSMHCSKKNVTTTLTVRSSKWSTGFNVTPDDCFFIKIKDGEFLEDLHNDMMDRFDPKRKISF